MKLPDRHLFIAHRLLCIPLQGMSAAEQTKMIEHMLSFHEKELTVGPLGTVEYYEKYYAETI